jgi:hypothetical protein
LDRSIDSNAVCTALVSAGLNVERHSAHFNDVELDTVWLPEVARRGWISFTRDDRIRYRPIERQAIVQSQARVFCVVSSGLTGSQLGSLLVGHLAKISDLIRSTPGPFMAAISRDAVVVRLSK